MRKAIKHPSFKRLKVEHAYLDKQTQRIYKTKKDPQIPCQYNVDVIKCSIQNLNHTFEPCRHMDTGGQ